MRTYAFPVQHVAKKFVAWITLIIGILAVGVFQMLTSSLEPGNSAPATLPPDSDSYQVKELTSQFEGGDATPAIAVFSKNDDSPLTPADLGAINESVAAMSGITLPEAAREQLDTAVDGSGIKAVSPVIPLSDNAAQSVLALPGDINGTGLSKTVKEMRESGKDSLPEGITLELSGPAGFAADTAAAFEGANFTLLGISALVVAVLLIFTYRSPILWLVPLLVVAIADRVASMFVEFVAGHTALSFDASTSGIMSVLVFGAGTNYALLLISRYREELRTHEDHREALSVALRASVPAIVSSNLTVVLALLALIVTLVPAYKSLGIALSMGLLVALAFSLFVLPAALSLCGRGIFWPKVPKVDPSDTKHENSSLWFRIGGLVSKAPRRILAAMLVVLFALASGIAGANVGLSTTEQFRTESEAVDGLETIAKASSPGAAAPLTVIASSESSARVPEAVASVPGVSVQGPPTASKDGSLQKFTVIADAAPATPESYEQIRQLRTAVENVDQNALVGGQSAEAMDTRDATKRDTIVVLPIILVIVFVLLVVVLRSIVAPILLLFATSLSAAAALGAGALVSEHVFGFPALDVSVPLYALIFLVALGIDYTVFLVLRAKEEKKNHGTRDGMTRAVGLTGGVITSAGIVLAAVFAVLGVLPLITLGQVGIVVGLGILIDTFLVRTLVVPALFDIFGDRMWWPSKAKKPLPKN
ncbi:MMPL family transporter [Corynebacterium sp. H78]|uniref:MMPL family transporter n=1 Tax=Corynebacterium sp. H78 TaxID=3133417 RepID=UPI003094AAD3